MIRSYKIFLFFFLFVSLSSNAQVSTFSTSCNVYMDASPLNRTTAFTTTIDEENIASGVYAALAQRYNSLSGNIAAVRFWGRVPTSVGVSQTARVKIYTENVGYPATTLGQTTISIPSSDSLVQIDALFSPAITVSANTIISIEPFTPSTDNFWIGHNRATDGLNLYLNLIKQGTSWYKNLSNGDPSWDYDFLILPMKTVSINSNFSTSTSSLTATFTNTSTGASSYLWDFGDGINSATISPSHTYATAGSYNVKLKAFGNPVECVDSITTSVNVVVTGINSNHDSKKDMLKLSSNLVKDYLTIESSDNLNISVYNVLGTKLESYELKKNQPLEINVENLETGIYFIRSSNLKPLRFVKCN